jgi:hypothetical protein
VVGLPWAADSCPWVGKLRTVLPIIDVIRDSAVQLVLTHQRGGRGQRTSRSAAARAPLAWLMGLPIIEPLRSSKSTTLRAKVCMEGNKSPPGCTLRVV